MNGAAAKVCWLHRCTIWSTADPGPTTEYPRRRGLSISRDQEGMIQSSSAKNALHCAAHHSIPAFLAASDLNCRNRDRQPRRSQLQRTGRGRIESPAIGSHRVFCIGVRKCKSKPLVYNLRRIGGSGVVLEGRVWLPCEGGSPAYPANRAMCCQWTSQQHTDSGASQMRPAETR